MKTTKLSVAAIAQSLGFQEKPFKIKTGKQAGSIDEKKTVLYINQGAANVRIAALRAITKLKPLGIKLGSSDAFVFFNKTQVERLVSINEVS